jgi:hypothetical protein
MDAYDTGKGLPEQIDREGNTGFMRKIAAHPAGKPMSFQYQVMAELLFSFCPQPHSPPLILT